MRINKKSDLPKWFKLSDYEIYKDMKDDDMLDQLCCRSNALMVGEFKKDGFFGKKISNGLYVEDYEELPVTINQVNRLDINYSYSLTEGAAISPLSVRDLRFMSRELLSESNININVEPDPKLNDRFLHVSAINKESLYFEGFFCRINLMKHDDIIIDELKELLNDWREELDLEKPEPTIKNGWNVVRDKLIAYSAIPLIDLMLWEVATGNKITNGVLAVTLFPDGEYDSIQMNQTIKKFVVALLDYRTIEKIAHEISTK